jgi:hypothetical protein
MTFFLEFEDIFEKSNKSGKKSSTVHVKTYKKTPGGYMGGVNEEYARAEFKKLDKNPNYKSKINSHTREAPKPTASEQKQKKINNKLAAEGKKYRVEVTAGGKTKKVSLQERRNNQQKKREKEFRKKNKATTKKYSKEIGFTPGAAYNYK